MQTIDLAIDFRDLMSDKEGAKVTASKMQTSVVNMIEQAVVSSFDEPAGAIEQRKVDRILDLLESTKEGGKLIINDKLFAELQTMWEGRKFKIASGADRKLIQRIDRQLCPDAYKDVDDEVG